MNMDWVILQRLLIAAALSGLIGFEREHRGKRAGLRTHMLVAVGSALFVSFVGLFVISSQALAPGGSPGNFRIQIEPLAVVEAIVSGISFLGAGTIFVSGQQNRVHGLTTAASIWVTAAIGIAVGLEHYVLAAGTTLLVLVILHLLSVFDMPPAKERSEDPPSEASQ